VHGKRWDLNDRPVMRGRVGGGRCRGMLSDLYAELIAVAGLTALEHGVWLIAATQEPSSLRSLARQARTSWHRTTASCALLREAGWMTLEESSLARRPVAIVPPAVQVKAASAFEERYSLAPNRGEFLMKRLLDLWLHSDRFVDNARPSFLGNPATNYPLEYDRYYFEGVAFEFNGPQHSNPGQAGPDQAFRDTLTRDLVKAALSQQAQIELVVLTAEDLRPERFERRLPKQMRRRQPDLDGPYYHALTRICVAYADKALRSGRK